MDSMLTKWTADLQCKLGDLSTAMGHLNYVSGGPRTGVLSASDLAGGAAVNEEAGKGRRYGEAVAKYAAGSWCRNLHRGPGHPGGNALMSFLNT